MAIGTPVSIGTAANKVSGDQDTITTTVAVPAGALIVVCIGYSGYSENSDITITDSAGNSYTKGPHQAAGFDTFSGALIAYKTNAVALPSGGTITIDWFTSGVVSNPDDMAASAFYCEGIATTAALDQSGTNLGSSTSPTISTAGATSQADELTVAIVVTEGAQGDAFTQDGSPAYATPPDRIGTTGGAAATNTTVAGGYFIETTTGIKSYTPTLGNSRDWTGAIATFKGATGLTGSADLPGAGSLTASGALTALASSALAGTGTLATVTEITAQAALSGVGALAANGTLVFEASTTLAGTGALAAAGDLSKQDSATLAGDSALAAAGDLSKQGTATMAGAGAFAASGALTIPAAAALAGVGALGVVSEITAQAVLTGVGALGIVSEITAKTTLPGVGTLAVVTGVTAGADLTGMGALTVPNSDITAFAPLVASGGHLFAAVGEYVATATLPGIGALAANGNIAGGTGAALVMGSGALTAEALRTTYGHFDEYGPRSWA